MSVLTKKTAPLGKIITYTFPVLHTKKHWFIDFRSYDPITQTMKRKKYMLNHIKSIKDRRIYAKEVLVTLSVKLRSGWSPWIDNAHARAQTNYIDVTELYHKYLVKLHKSGSIKESTLLDYKKRLKVLEEYNTKRQPPIAYIFQFDRTYISDFLDYIFMDRDASARTRNNYRIWLSSFCGWLIEKQYLETNPVENIKALTEDEKKRIALTPADLNKMKSYLEKENPHFLLLCQFCYYTFIRPDELSNIKLKDINLKEQKVFINSSISKNRRDGMVGLNDTLIKAMLDLNVFDSDNNSYLFGEGFKPSKRKSTARVYRTQFNKMREILKFPDTYQFYSLKDSGIRDLANSEGIVVARDQARHSDVSTTNKYLKGESMTVHEETKRFTGLL